MPANLENPAVAAELENVSFHSSSKEGQCKRMFKLPHNCTHFTSQQGHTQNPSSQASIVHELRTSRCTSWLQKRQGNQRSSCQRLLDHRKFHQENSRKISTSASLTMLKPLTGQITTNYGRFLKRWECQTPYLSPEKPVCRPRSNSQNWT